MKKWMWWLLIGIVTIAMIKIPILIHTLSPSVISEISADGLLGYLGNCVAAIPTIFVAVVAIWQSSNANKIAEEANRGAAESDKIAEKANEIAEKALLMAEQSNAQTDYANKIAEKSNEISQKLFELEDMRQRLELRPSFAVTAWKAPLKNLSTITMNPEQLSVANGEYSDGVAWGIELSLLNTSSGFETICFNNAVDNAGKQVWKNSMMGMTSRKIELPTLETKSIYFYADKEFWVSQIGKRVIVDFYVNNRLDVPYREKFELYIMSMDDKVPHKEGEVYLYLEIQKYNVGKCVESEEYPDGVIWEK